MKNASGWSCSPKVDPIAFVPSKKTLTPFTFLSEQWLQTVRECRRKKAPWLTLKLSRFRIIPNRRMFVLWERFHAQKCVFIQWWIPCCLGFHVFAMENIRTAKKWSEPDFRKPALTHTSYVWNSSHKSSFLQASAAWFCSRNGRDEGQSKKMGALIKSSLGF